MASVQLLTAGSREGGRDPSRFPLLLLLSDTGFAVGGGHPHLTAVCAQLLGSVSGPGFCPGLHDVSLWAPRYQLSQAQSQAYLFSRGMSLRQVAGSREEASCGHILIDSTLSQKTLGFYGDPGSQPRLPLY